MRVTEDGKKLASFIAAVADFHDNLSQMLTVAGEMLGKKGWEPTDSTCWTDTSIGYFNPHKWRPREVFRFFKSEEWPHALACLCVLLEKRGGEKQPIDLSEPLASVVWFDYGDTKPESNWEVWFSRWYSFSPAANLGEWMTDQVAKLSPDEVEKHDYRWTSVRGMGVPLAEIKTAEDLKSRLLEPLLLDISERSKSQKQK